MNLARKVWQRTDIIRNKTVLVCAVACLIFTVLPYLANLYAAIKVTGVVKHNQAAKTWFKHNAAFFSVLVIATGGCYPALAVVSSNMFGHPLTSSGLTQYELSKLSRIRIWNTVVLENIPQLCVQVLLTAEIGEIEEYVFLAFLASVLSVFVSTLIYFIGRASDGTVPTEYHLAVHCARDRTNQSPVPMHVDTRPHRKQQQHDGHDQPSAQRGTAIQQIKPSTAEREANQITDREEGAIAENRGRRLRLARTLSALYRIQPKALEVGATLCTKYGFKTHCVQFVDELDLQRMRQQLADTNHGVIAVPAELYIERLYNAVQGEIAVALRTHFNLSSDFEVELVQNRDDKGRNAGGTQARLMFALRNFLADENPEKVQTLMDMLEGNPIADAPEADKAGAAEQGTTELQMVAMSTRTENDSESSSHDAGVSMSMLKAADSDVCAEEKNQDNGEDGGQDATEFEAKEQEPATPKVDEMRLRAVCTKKDCDIVDYAETVPTAMMEDTSVWPDELKEHVRVFHSDC